MKIALILSGDINLNPGTVTRHQINDPKFEAFNSKRLHLIDLNIDSILPKIDELRNIAKYSNSVVIGITETKLGNTVSESEANINGYNIVRNYIEVYLVILGAAFAIQGKHVSMTT